jgi:hypothetical protein
MKVSRQRRRLREEEQRREATHKTEDYGDSLILLFGQHSGWALGGSGTAHWAAVLHLQIFSGQLRRRAPGALLSPFVVGTALGLVIAGEREAARDTHMSHGGSGGSSGTRRERARKSLHELSSRGDGRVHRDKDPPKDWRRGRS